jgi:pyrroline-5-carboxylate reductase
MPGHHFSCGSFANRLIHSTISGMSYHLGIIGAGNMAEAIVRGVLRGKVLTGEQIIAVDVSPTRREMFADQLGVTAVLTNAQVLQQRPRCLLLSVKPQQMAGVLQELAPELPVDTLVISIAAGISASFIAEHLGKRSAWRVIRTMPNTPMLVGQGMVAIARGAHATAEDVNQARELFESAAKVVEVSETLIDAVTAVSGSGPAYVFYLVERMIQAGVELGLSPEDARTLAVQTATGAAAMLASSTDSAAELRRKVTSPGGTTQAAITHLDAKGVGPAIVEAMKAAAQRSKELGA